MLAASKWMIMDCLLVGWLSTVDCYISTSNRWVVIKFWSEIHGPQRMDPNERIFSLVQILRFLCVRFSLKCLIGFIKSPAQQL